MNVVLDRFCAFCFRLRDTYSNPPLHQFTYTQRSQGSSASFGTTSYSTTAASSGRSTNKAAISKARPTSEGASQESGSPIRIRHHVTSEESSISLPKTSKHAHGPLERELSLEKPVDETQNYKKPDKSAITGNEIPIREYTYEQWIADRILRDVSGDTRPSDDVEQGSVHESDLDSLFESLIQPKTSDRSSDDAETSDETRTKTNNGPSLPSVLYMLLLRVCGIVTRLLEPNPLPGRTRIRWRCVSHSRYITLIKRHLFTGWSRCDCYGY